MGMVYGACVFAAGVGLWLAATRFTRSNSPRDGAIGEPQKFKVQHVIDGDTVVVGERSTEIRVRLFAIDCPEGGQPWGNIARAGLIKMIGGRSVRLESHGQDQHGRTLATLYVQRNAGSEWTNVNERMVMLGHAWVARKFCGALPVARQAKLDQLEDWAKSKRVGLWKSEEPVPPWVWRRLQ